MTSQLMNVIYFTAMFFIIPFGTLNARTKFGGMDSGGGHAVVCRDNGHKIVSAELYDYYEAKKINNVTLITDGESKTASELVQMLIERIPSRDKDRRESYQNGGKSFFSSDHDGFFVSYLENVELAFIDDANTPIGIPGNCRIEQLAIQRDPEFDGDPAYIVNKDIWLKLSPLDQAGLVLHELIYRDARNLGAKNSKLARHFNVLLAINPWSRWQDDADLWNDYVQTLDGVRLSTDFTWNFVASDGSFYANHLDLRATSFRADGSLENLGFNPAYHQRQPAYLNAPALDSCQPIFGGRSGAPHLPIGDASLYANGCLRDIFFDYGNPNYSDITPRLVSLYGGSYAEPMHIAFEKDGSLKCMDLHKAATLMGDKDNGILNIEAFSSVFFDASGRVTEYHVPNSFPDFRTCAPDDDE